MKRALLQGFRRFWELESNPGERRKLPLSLFQQVVERRAAALYRRLSQAP
jgi:hypothetical protein